MKTTYKEMEQKIRNKIPFDGNSVRATLDLKNIYRIYSYGTMIYDSNRQYFNNAKYSTTTSKIQNMLIDIFGLNNGVKKRD